MFDALGEEGPTNDSPLMKHVDGGILNARYAIIFTKYP
jgi:hypothetical protein